MDSSDNLDSSPSYRGAIRHIQSEDEIHFNTWRDAVDFIQRYVPLETGMAGLEIADDLE